MAANLTKARLVAFAATTDPVHAKVFYRDVLGLRLVSEDPFALMFDANGTMLRVTALREAVIAPYTVLGWDVEDIAAAVRGLGAEGVKFERYPGIAQDEFGIWTSPSGTRVAWFKDPDGNTLSLSQMDVRPAVG